jgi:hypothetical protein
VPGSTGGDELAATSRQLSYSSERLISSHLRRLARPVSGRAHPESAAPLNALAATINGREQRYQKGIAHPHDPRRAGGVDKR